MKIILTTICIGILQTFCFGRDSNQQIHYSQDSLMEETDSVKITITVGFTVTKKALIKDVEIVKVEGPTINSELLEQYKSEAIRVVSEMDGWEPGKKRGKPVDVTFNLPIVFIVSKEEITKEN